MIAAAIQSRPLRRPALMRWVQPLPENGVVVYVGGVNFVNYIRKGSFEVEDVLNDAPNRATFVCSDLIPVEGQVVQMYRGSVLEPEFAGHVISVQQFYEGIIENVAYHVTCTDYTWKLNRRLVTKRWLNTSPSTIAAEILSGFTTGFTGTNIAAGLAAIPEFRCDEELPSRALTRLCAEFGGSHYVDYELDLHLFVTEVTDAPEDISDLTLATTTARGLAHVGDLSQARTRLKGVGIGTSAIENLAIVDTSIPIEKADMFEAAGGSFKSTENIGAYTGRHLGGLAAIVVGNVAGPASAAVAALTANVVGVLAGIFKYKVSFANDQGETTPGSESNAVTGVAFAAPGAGSANAGSTIGRLIGAFLYKVTFVTALGETTGGTQFSRTAVATSAPSSPSVSNTGSQGKLIGAYGYKVTFESAFGESSASGAGTNTANAMTGPSAPTCGGTTIGPLHGSYYYKISFVGTEGYESMGTVSSQYTHTGSTASTPNATGTAGGGLKGRARVAWRHALFGESIWSPHDEYDANTPITVTASSLPSGCTWVVFYTGPFTGGAEATAPYYRGSAEYTTGGAQNIDNAIGTLVSNALNTMGGNCSLTNISTGASGVVARRIYRTKEGASSSGPFYLVGEIGDNSTTTWSDVVPDAALTQAAPTQNLNGQSHTVSSVSTGPTGTTKRNIYRTEAGGSIYYFLREIGDNSTTSFTDNATDAELDKGLTAPGSSTSGDQHALSSIPTGPTGTLARRIYRTTAGGSAFQFLTELTDNSATTFTDNIDDTSLGGFIPLVNTAGANQVSLTSIPTGSSAVTKRVIYRTEAGGSVFKYLATLNDNATTTYTDNIPDAGLGREALTQSTIGAIAGDTTLLLSTVTGWPTAGWLKAGSQIIRWTGISSTSLTGIPGARAMTITRSGTVATATTTGNHGFATNDIVTIHGAVQGEYNGAPKITVTGLTTFTYTVPGAPATPATGTIVVYAAGAILASIQGGSGVVTAPFLSGVSGLTYTVEKGAPVRIYVVRNDAAAQTALGLLEGGDGIHEAPLDDASIATVAQLTAACDAELAAYSTKLRSVTFRSRDPLLRSGKTVTLDLGSPTNQSGDFLIQRVISSEFDIAEDLYPMREVIAAPVLVSFRDVLRRSQSERL